MAEVRYRYELRSGDGIIATGHLTWEHPLERGDQITIGTSSGIVKTIGPVLGSDEHRLVVQMSDPGKSRERA